ncbi:MAG: glycosyltransferase family 8 protein [Bacteroidia bacterium]|nr:glycosyltransferase family 8 protein [Bacteroidia bacterium]
MNRTRVPLVIAFTPNYFIPAATCLWSVLKHSNAEDSFHVICLMAEDLPDTLLQKLKWVDKNNQVHFSFIRPEDKLQGVYVDEKYTVAASYRLLLPTLLPQYDQVIYLDCDMIIRNNLAALYRRVDVSGNYLAAVFEATLDFQVPNIEKLGCKPGEYFNSGFLVINLHQLRRDDMERKFIEALKVDYLEFPDQDVLNMLCQGRVAPLPPYYNSIRTFYLPQYKPCFLKYYTHQDWDAVQQHGNIHYTGGKPWNGFTVEFDVWWRYYLELPAKVRENEMLNKKMLLLYRIYANKWGRKSIEGLRKLYRKLK